eukprot:1620400-Lingulodinium_polyedra.AAC.1
MGRRLRTVCCGFWRTAGVGTVARRRSPRVNPRGGYQFRVSWPSGSVRPSTYRCARRRGAAGRAFC